MRMVNCTAWRKGMFEEQTHNIYAWKKAFTNVSNEAPQLGEQRSAWFIDVR